MMNNLISAALSASATLVNSWYGTAEDQDNNEIRDGLFRAVEHDDLDAYHRLARHVAADLRVTNDAGQSLLQVAILNGSDALVPVLIEVFDGDTAVLDINDHDGFTALMYAIQKERIDLVRQLIDARATYADALMQAVLMDRPSIARVLIDEFQTDPTAALDLLVVMGQADHRNAIVLWHLGADTSALIATAAQREDKEYIREILRLPGHHLYHALQRVIKASDLSAAKLLLDFDGNKRVGQQVLAKAAKRADLPGVKLMIDAGAPGAACLARLSTLRQNVSVKTLLDAGVDPTGTVMDLARSSDDVAVRTLIDSEADVDKAMTELWGIKEISAYCLVKRIIDGAATDASDGADDNMANSDSEAISEYVLQDCRRDMTAVLRRRTNLQNVALLRRLLMGGHLDVAAKLVTVDEHVGESALQIALSTDDHATVQSLMSLGVTGMSTFCESMHRHFEEDRKNVHSLMSLGVSPSAVLMYAMLKGDTIACKVLLFLGADLTAALVYAAETDNRAGFAALVRAGADMAQAQRQMQAPKAVEVGQFLKGPTPSFTDSEDGRDTGGRA